ncbi:hypothetical protein ACFYPX_05185 [Micromonospora zamorensis]|uniref:hypothetical protein n=1 Tax=Micromonospora zamorensis TaxID=709883 RepID=UPI0036A424B6
MLPAAASWVRAVRPALAVGLVVSSLGFAALHGSSDSWFFGYFTCIGLCTGLMAIRRPQPRNECCPLHVADALHNLSYTATAPRGGTRPLRNLTLGSTACVELSRSAQLLPPSAADWGSVLLTRR